MPERVGTPRADVSPHVAVCRLAELAAFAHYNPGKVSRKLYELMAVHKALNTKATVAYAEALALLDEIGARDDAEHWVHLHRGRAGMWPTAELDAMRQQVRLVEPS